MLPGDLIPHSTLPSAEIGTALQLSTMNITYGQLFEFMATFTNQQLDDAQIIAYNLHDKLGRTYNQCLVDILVEIRKEELAS